MAEKVKTKKADRRDEAHIRVGKNWITGKEDKAIKASPPCDMATGCRFLGTTTCTVCEARQK